jgi:hypothetical protein
MKPQPGRSALVFRTMKEADVIDIRENERAAAEAAGMSVRTVSKWRRRCRVEGEHGLFDRSSAPSRCRRGQSRSGSR